MPAAGGGAGANTITTGLAVLAGTSSSPGSSPLLAGSEPLR